MNHSGRVVVSYKGKYVYEVLINGLTRKKVCLGELTVTIAVDFGRKATEQTKQTCMYYENIQVTITCKYTNFHKLYLGHLWSDFVV